MRIIIYDPYVGKFTTDMENHWLAQGHEVKRSTYYDPQFVAWADVLFFETSDNNILSATNPSAALLADDANFKPWDLHEYDLTSKRVIVRMIDIEVWQQHYIAPKWDVVTDIIFIAPHIRNLVELHDLDGFNPDKTAVHLIPCAVNLDRFHYKEHTPGFNIAVIAERWISKGTSEILQIALKLNEIDKRYKITWLGKRSDYQWEHAYRDEFVEHHKLNLEFINYLEGDNAIDEFLDDKNYLLSCSHKEAFGYNIAEAMAKGIKPVIHRFYGADGLWPDMTWDSVDQAIEMILNGDYDSASYRQYLINQGYTLPQMMEKIDAIINKEKV